MSFKYGQRVEAIINGRPRTCKYLRQVSPDVVEVEYLGLPKFVRFDRVSPIAVDRPVTPRFERGYKELYPDD